jgi:hypothetical protein
MKESITNIHPTTQVGRWCIPANPEYSQKATLIMDRSNEDHCGGCGNNLLFSKNDEQNDYIINIKNDKNTFTNTYLVNNIFNENERYYFPFTL